MTQVFHVVGEQGSGKSSLILMMAAGFEARGMKCAGVDSCQEARSLIRAEVGADVMFLEYLPGERIDAQPDDTVIELARVPRLRIAATSHQEVVGRLDSLDGNVRKRAEIASVVRDIESKALRDDCGAIGHVYGSDPFGFSLDVRVCRICGLAEAQSHG